MIGGPKAIFDKKNFYEDIIGQLYPPKMGSDSVGIKRKVKEEGLNLGNMKSVGPHPFPNSIGALK